MKSQFTYSMLLLFALSFICHSHPAIGQTPSNTIRSVLDVQWSVAGDHYAIVDNIGMVSIINFNDSTVLFQSTPELNSVFKEASVAWSPNGHWLAAGLGSHIYIWNVETLTLVHTFVAGNVNGSAYVEGFGQVAENIITLSWSSDNRYLASGSLSNFITIWDNQQNCLIYHEKPLRNTPPTRTWLTNGLLSDGKSNLDPFTKILTVMTSQEYSIIAELGEIYCTERNKSNNIIAMAGVNGAIAIVDATTLTSLKFIRIITPVQYIPMRPITDLSWDKTGGFIAAITLDGEISIVNYNTGVVLTLTKIKGQLNAIDWNPYTNEIIYGGVSDTGQPILVTTDVSGFNGVPPMTPTATSTSTSTPTATPTLAPTSMAGLLRLQYYPDPGHRSITVDSLEPDFRIMNPTSSAIPLSEFKIRYYFTKEGTSPLVFNCWYTSLPLRCNNITGTFVTLPTPVNGADTYLEVGFTGTTESVPANGSTGEILVGIRKQDWSNFNQSNDYSFQSRPEVFSGWDHVTLYRNGSLVWGVVPQ